jgi:leucyl/phenylalanyl-tRNA---protein transferase
VTPIEPPASIWQLPDPLDAPAGEDLIVLGADLEPGTVLAAYRSGLFPMYVDVDDGTTVLGWWSPDPRGILPLDNLQVSRSLRKSIRRFTITMDTCFTEVMRHCASPERDSGWITDDFIDTYTSLHELGWAHSVEVWNAQGALVGGLYGIQVKGFFAGESMFHLERDASKVALVALVEYLKTHAGPHLLDVQWATDHLRSLGVVEVSRTAYLQHLADVLNSHS